MPSPEPQRGGCTCRNALPAQLDHAPHQRPSDLSAESLKGPSKQAISPTQVPRAKSALTSWRRIPNLETWCRIGRLSTQSYVRSCRDILDTSPPTHATSQNLETVWQDDLLRGASAWLFQ